MRMEKEDKQQNAKKARFEDPSKEVSPRKNPNMKKHMQQPKNKKHPSQYNSKRALMHGNFSGQTQSKTFNNDFSNKKTHSGARKHNANQQGRKKSEAQEQHEFLRTNPNTAEVN